MTAAQRGRGWLGVAALALATAVLSVAHPALLIFVPLALLFIALPPRRPMLLALGVFIGWLTFGGTWGTDPLWFFERGWALLLGAWFVVMVALLPESRFLPRALAALGATAVTAAIFLVVNRDGFATLDGAVTAHLRTSAEQLVAMLSQSSVEERIRNEGSRMIYAAADMRAKLFPALLALASLAGLGVAWWAFGRVAQGQPQPLGSLREFRFRDELVWLFIAGMLLLLMPLNDLATRAGENLLTFMAALYALRGAAVLLVIGGAPGPFTMVIGALMVVFLTPFVMATTFLVGLSDTWLDIRARREASTTPGS